MIFDINAKNKKSSFNEACLLTNEDLLTASEYIQKMLNNDNIVLCEPEIYKYNNECKIAIVKNDTNIFIYLRLVNDYIKSTIMCDYFVTYKDGFILVSRKEECNDARDNNIINDLSNNITNYYYATNQGNFQIDSDKYGDHDTPTNAINSWFNFIKWANKMDCTCIEPEYKVSIYKKTKIGPIPVASATIKTDCSNSYEIQWLGKNKAYIETLVLNDNTQERVLKSLKESNSINEQNDYNSDDYDSFVEVLNNTKYNNIWLTSDWHLYKSHYKKEKNLINKKDIVYFCRNKLTKNDVFMYLGDISSRWATDENNKKAQDILKSINSKVKCSCLIIGNHDEFIGEEFYSNCGFDYVFNKFEYNNLIFTHRPINMDLYPDDYLNIHGHMHESTDYNTTDGHANINVYPYFYNNKPVKLSYLLSHSTKLMKNNKWNMNYMLGESVVENDSLINLHDLKIESCNNGYDKLDAVLNMDMLDDININDL